MFENSKPASKFEHHRTIVSIFHIFTKYRTGGLNYIYQPGNLMAMSKLDIQDDWSRRRMLMTGGAVVTFSVFAGCLGDDDGDEPTPTPGETEPEQEIHITQPIEPRHNYDPVVTDDSYSETLVNHIYDRLYQFGEGFEVSPNLAVDDPEIERDGLRYVVEIVDNAYWQDGDPVTSEDVLHSLVAPVHEMTTPSIFFQMIDLDASTTIDEHTVQFDLTERYAPFQVIPLWQLIVKKDARLEAMGFDSEEEYWNHNFADDPRSQESPYNKENPIGSGPFKYVDHVAGEFTDLERWDDYWGADRWRPLPNIERIRFVSTEDDAARTSQIRAGDTDMITEVPPPDWDVIQNDDNVVLHSTESVGYNFIEYNCNEGPTAERDVRHGIEHAFSMENFVEETIGDAAVNSIAPLSTTLLEQWNLPIDEYAALENEYDPERAADLIGPHVDQPWEPILLAPPDDTREALIERVGARLEELGEYGVEIQPRVRRLDWGVYAETARSGNADDYQLHVSGWTGGPDPDYNISFLFHKNNEGFVQGHYYRPDTDFHEKIEEAGMTLDEGRRIELYEEILFEILEEKVHTPGYTLMNSAATLPYVQDVEVHGSGRLFPRVVSNHHNTYISE